MSVDKYGSDVGTEQRIKDIKLRYGEDSIIYFNCVNLVKKLKSKGVL